jgi:hypothetical protein
MSNNRVYALLRAVKRGATVIDPDGMEVEHDPRMPHDRYPWRRKGEPSLCYRSRDCRTLWPDGQISEGASQQNSQEALRPPRPRRLGFTQARVLRTMQKPGMGVWHPSAGWRIGNSPRTVRVMDSLAKKNLVEKVQPHKYRLTDAGRAWKLY